MFQDHEERRVYYRTPLRRAVKLYDPLSRRYRGGATVNVCGDGALLEIRGSLLSMPGDPVAVAVDWNGDRPALSRREMRAARLVRIEPVDLATGTQRIGVCFSVAASAARAA